MTGYRSPPVEHQFKKGQSGNPAGRRRGSKRRVKKRTPFLDERTTITIGGKKQKLSRREALMRVAALVAYQKNDLDLQRLLISLKETLDKAQSHIQRERKFFSVGPLPADSDDISCIEDAAQVSGFGKKAYLKCKTGRVLLESWVIEEAFEQLGDRRLGRDEQEIVLASARFPKRINWPDWWGEDLRERSNGWRASQNPTPYVPSEKPEGQSVGLREYLASKPTPEPTEVSLEGEDLE